MADSLVAEETKDFVLHLFDKNAAYGIEEWEGLTPIEFGVLSWHLGNFYCSPLWWVQATAICEPSFADVWVLYSIPYPPTIDLTV